MKRTVSKSHSRPSTVDSCSRLVKSKTKRFVFGADQVGWFFLGISGIHST